MKQDQRSMLIAMGLSLLVMVGWQYFYAGPKMEQMKLAQQQAQAEKVEIEKGNVPASPLQAPLQAAFSEARDEIIKDTPRINIETNKLLGSIGLKGAVFDDLSLKDYQETVDPKSPIVSLLYPNNTPQAFSAGVDFVPAPGSSTILPSVDTLWQNQLQQSLTTQTPLELTYDNGHGLSFIRKISVDDQYMFTVTDTIKNSGTEPVSFYPHALVWRYNHPQLAGYAALHEGLIGWVSDGGLQEWGYDPLYKEANHQHKTEGNEGWVGITDKYWAAAVIPVQGRHFEAKFSANGETNRIYRAETIGDLQTVAANDSVTVSTRVFAGAKVSQVLDHYQIADGIKNFDLLISWGWFHFIAKPMFALIDFLYKFFGNFGFAILAVTLIVKGLFFPLAHRSYVSMARMKQLQPKIAAIKERHSDDPQKQQEATMALYKQEKINPVAGCLPMLIQIPVFFALYKVLLIAIEMRHAPFVGWIKDLSAPDPTNIFTMFGLLHYDPTALPLLGSFMHLGIWPLLMGVSMFLQMKLNPEPADPVQKQMFAWMPVIFTLTMGGFASGLVIYWTWNNILTIIQQATIMRHQGVKIELYDNLLRSLRVNRKDAG